MEEEKKDQKSSSIPNLLTTTDTNGNPDSLRLRHGGEGDIGASV